MLTLGTCGQIGSSMGSVFQIRVSKLQPMGQIQPATHHLLAKIAFYIFKRLRGWEVELEGGIKRRIF